MAEHPLILIVDDEAAFREIFSVKLSSAGFHVETAESAETGIVKIKELKPDLVLMDVNMPTMDGPTALMQLRSDPETKNVKVVFLTSLGDPRAEVQEINNKFAEEFGAAGYIKKTDDLDMTLEKVRIFISS